MTEIHTIDNSDPIWNDPDFPDFYSNAPALKSLEDSLKRSTSPLRRMKENEGSQLQIEEVYFNSKIEGIELDRSSIESSVLNNLVSPVPKQEKEFSAVALMKMVLDNKNKPLTHEILKDMNKLLLSNSNNDFLKERAGEYVGDMLIVKGGRLDRTIIEDRGIPKDRVDSEMSTFIDWFNKRDPETPLKNALQGHLHFEKLHPFADGNGRIGRALMNMSLMSDLNLKHPVALSKAIETNRSVYYDSFKSSSLDLTEHIKKGSGIIKSAVNDTKKIMELTAYKAELFKIGNERQVKAINKVVSYEIKGEFEGVLNNKKYRKLAGCDEKTAQRDLKSLASKGFLNRSGQLKATKYELAYGKNRSNER